MKITLNGDSHDCADGIPVAELLTELSLAGQRIAVELNGEIVPRSEFANRQLGDGDSVEIVHAIGGG